MHERTYNSKDDFITLDSVDSLVLDRDPSFIDYLFFQVHLPFPRNAARILRKKYSSSRKP